MLSILGKLLRLGIPKSWKESKVTLIYTKGFTDDPANFHPIFLPNTMYKLYSGILISELIRIHKENNGYLLIGKGFFTVSEAYKSIFCLRIGDTVS